jgi:ATP-binding cassette, subfamily F, member 3
VIVQYFAQDEATRLDPTLTVYQTLAGDAPIHMVPHIRNILGGFLFSGDDVDKYVRVLSGGERTRLAVARMLLRPSNTLLLDEPTNHLDLDSKDVLLEALEDFGGTLIFVSHDRYFVDKLATKVIEIGGGHALMYPGNYEEFLWSRKQQEVRLPASGSRLQGAAASGSRLPASGRSTVETQKASPRTRTPEAPNRKPEAESRKPEAESGKPRAESRKPEAESRKPDYEDRKRQEAEARKQRKAQDARRRRIEELEARIAEKESEIKQIEAQMTAAGFYDNHETAKPVIDRHQALMWEVGDLMGQWEALQEQPETQR